MKRWRKQIPDVLFYLMIATIVLAGAGFASRGVTALAKSEALARAHCIVIDAGHGGEDGGATSCTGVSESGINLDIALRLNDLLHLLGYQTKMIRTTDTAVYTQGTTIAEKKLSDLKERVRIVNATENAIFVSIHQNHFSDARYWGAQVFYPENSESEALANALQQAFLKSINQGSNRKTKKASGVYVMEHISCPAILVECGFLSNFEEECRLRTPEYQKNLACVMASCLSGYLQAMDIGTA